LLTTLNGAFVGCGTEARALMQDAWKPVTGVHPAGCWDDDLGRASGFAFQHDLTAHPSLEALMATKPDIVVATADGGWPAQRALALSQGIGLIVAAPGAATLEAFDALAAKAAERNAVLTVGYPQVFGATSWVLDLIGLGLLGDVYEGHALYTREHEVDRTALPGPRLPDMSTISQAVAPLLATQVGRPRAVRASYEHGKWNTVDGSRDDPNAAVNLLKGTVDLAEPRSVGFTARELYADHAGESLELRLKGTDGSAQLTLSRDAVHGEEVRAWAELRVTDALLATLPRNGFPSSERAFQARDGGRRIHAELPRRGSITGRAGQLRDLALAVRAHQHGLEQPPRVAVPFARTVLEVSVLAGTSATTGEHPLRLA
jgi:predicted dehydrogenase